MNAEEKEVIRDTVQLGVMQAMEPIWEKVRSHDTQIALLKQDSKQGQNSQIAQGTRLGDVEKRSDKHSTYWKVLWVAFLGFIGFVGWIISKLITVLSE